MSPYELCLFRVMCSLTFYAFLRVGEMVATNNNKSLLSTDNIAKLVNAANHVVSLKVTFLHHKHSYNQPLFRWSYVSLLSAPFNLCSITWNYEAILEAPFSLSVGFRFIDSIFAVCLPLLLSVAVLSRHATEVIVFESELPLMRRGGNVWCTVLCFRQVEI